MPKKRNGDKDNFSAYMDARTVRLLDIIANEEFTNRSILLEEAAWLLISQRLTKRPAYREIVSNWLDESN